MYTLIDAGGEDTRRRSVNIENEDVFHLGRSGVGGREGGGHLSSSPPLASPLSLLLSHRLMECVKDALDEHLWCTLDIRMYQ